ncbi:hypothetical protein [Streptomyces sp. NPDC059883]|uniref:hypothetical protein n=1 Tax=unclassified Streptomyces TaxID=2593676 RepID=UPI003658CE8A
MLKLFDDLVPKAPTTTGSWRTIRLAGASATHLGLGGAEHPAGGADGLGPQVLLVDLDQARAG